MSIRTHDFRRDRIGWGHNHYFKPQNTGLCYGPCWTGKRIKRGDLIFWSTNYGTAEAEVVEVEAVSDPSDMYWVTSRVVRRHADPNIVSQEELDASFR
jgi:hypothetical protein